MPAALEDARARGWRLAILSNTDRDFLDASLARIGVPFDATIVASEIGSYKPAPAHWDAFFAANRGRPRRSTSTSPRASSTTSRPLPGSACATIWINRLGEDAEPQPDVELRSSDRPWRKPRFARAAERSPDHAGRLTGNRRVPRRGRDTSVRPAVAARRGRRARPGSRAWISPATRGSGRKTEARRARVGREAPRHGRSHRRRPSRAPGARSWLVARRPERGAAGGARRRARSMP